MKQTRYRYRNISKVDEDRVEPLYWSNQDGWVTEGYDTFTEAEIKALRPPMDGIPEPVADVILFECGSGVVPVEVFEALYLIDIDNLHGVVDTLVMDEDWKPDTDEETIHEACRRMGIKNYRIIPTKGVFNLLT